jgi:hypothetical protein
LCAETKFFFDTDNNYLLTWCGIKKLFIEKRRYYEIVEVKSLKNSKKTINQIPKLELKRAV